jgi:hypothetical protein
MLIYKSVVAKLINIVQGEVISICTLLNVLLMEKRFGYKF